MSRSLIRSILLGAISLTGTGLAHAQLGWEFCENPTGESNPYIVYNLGNDTLFAEAGHDPIMQTSFGIQGSTTVPTGRPATCLGNYSVGIQGRYGFGAGDTGTIQTTADDWMMYTMGMPIFPGNTFQETAIDFNNARSLMGEQPFGLFFIGASNRYFKLQSVMGGFNLDVNVDLLGDAARYDLKVTNTGTDVAQVGLWEGGLIALLDNNQNLHGGIVAPAGPGSDPFISIPNQRTPKLETIWTRKDNPSVFPPYVDLDWSQSIPVGLRLETGPSPSTTDPVTGASDASQWDVFELGFHGDTVSGSAGLEDKISAPGGFKDGTFPLQTVEPGIQQSDVEYTDNPAYLMKILPKPVAAGASIEFVQYFRTTWAQSNYAPPYTVVIDAPKLFNYDPAGLNQLTPNPATFRVWIDNIRGFTTAEQEVALQNVRVTLDLTNSNGLTFVGGGKTQSKTIARIDSRQIAFVDFSVQADGIATGIQPFTVSVSAPPAASKTVAGTTDISTTPKMPVVAGSNLVAFPWTFTDTSLDSILGLTQPSQYQAFKWDSTQQGYVFATSAQRGLGVWLVITDPSIIPQNFVPLGSNPTLPGDMTTGAGTVVLQQGWNLIGNPYPYPIPLGDLLAIPQGDPTHAYSWQNLVNSGFVSSSLAYWDTTSSPPGYKFISGSSAYMQPNTGYWIFVNDLSVTLQFPPVFFEGANTTGGSPALKSRTAQPQFVQSATQYRLQVSARTNDEIDDQNFVGKADNAKDAQLLKIYEPPMGPKQSLGVSIGSDKPGETRLAQSLLSTTGPMQWTIYVKSNKADQITLTWPNMSTVPKNVTFRLTDTATGTSRDMRRTSGYTFQAAASSTRTFTIQAQAGSVSRAIIGNVVVSQGKGLDRNAPFTISYTLSADATTTIRILGAGGREVYTATRGRADVVGQNTATWALRDNANRAVAPGIYRVEITAETSDGERVRKIVPVNVIR